MTALRFSCVIDDSPLFKLQAFNWLWTIMASGSARPEEIVVHLIKGEDSSFQRALEGFGVAVRPIDRFGRGEAAYCNKLMQFDCSELRDADCIVLCDADLAFAGDIRPWITTQAVRAKVVDLPNPPLEALERLHALSGLKAKPQIVQTSFGKAQTFQTNCNGGLYIIPAPYFDDLSKSWIKWARFAFEKKELLANYRMHADQIGFCFAMLELNLPFEPLPDSLNFPTHLSLASYSPANDIAPLVLHYHRRIDQSGFLLPVGLAGVDSAIAQVNDVIRRRRHERFDSRTFFDYRYAHHPELGSGVGSRGEILAYRKDLLYPLLALYSEKEILDVGCGDLEVMAEASVRRYTGLDISPAAIAIAQRKRPDWTFQVGDVSAVAGRTFDLLLCGCVLIHVPLRESYLDQVRRMVDACRDTLVIEAYNKSPQYTSEITFYHEPISETLSRDSRIGQIKVIGSYRDVEVVLARRVEALPANPWHVSLDLLAKGLSSSSHPESLKRLVDFALERLGFFPKTSARMYEYPWAVDQAGEVRGLRLLDLGAGINPLPLWFASCGGAVVTVDNHPLIRALADRSNWIEWGFLDYASLDAAITSFHADFIDAEIPGLFDLVYSISVIEHVPAGRRRMIFSKISVLLRPGGRLLLTLDLVPGTRRLWNLSEGQVVDDSTPHGDLVDLIAELESAGFSINSYEIVTDIPESRTDIALITAAKKTGSG